MRTLVMIWPVLALAQSPLELALDSQDRKQLEALAADRLAKADQSPANAAAQYEAASAQSALAQYAIEVGDKGLSRSAAESGIRVARRAVDAAPNNAEHHRILGTLCGQVIPGNVMAGLKYGRCAKDELDKAVQMAPKSALVWLSRGIGNYYLPGAFGGGVDRAQADLQKAISLNPKLAAAHLWLGIALRKSGQNAAARKSIERSLELNPRNVWAKKQLEKTPAQ